MEALDYFVKPLVGHSGNVQATADISPPWLDHGPSRRGTAILIEGASPAKQAISRY